MKQPQRLTGDALLQRTDIWIEQATYTLPALEKYRNNPLLHALLPPQPWEIAAQLWRQRPPIDLQGRTYPNHQRLLLLLDALHFFEPLLMHEHLNMVIDGLLYEGYLPRNPLQVRARQTARERLALLHNGSTGSIIYTPTPRVIGTTIIAWPGMGKTASVRNKCGQQPDIILHDTFVDVYGQVHKLDLVQIPSMLLTCPEDGSTRSLCLEFFRQLDWLLGSNLYSIYARREYTKTMLMDQMAIQVAENHVGLLGFDELQRINRAASGGEEEMLDFFVRLMDRLPVPCAFIGTPATESILARLPHKIRRSDVLGDCRWKRLEPNEDWDNLVAALWPYQYLRQVVPLTPDYRAMLYRMSQGIVDYAVKLYLLAQVYAILTDTEELFSPATIQLARDEYLFFARGILEALESGDAATLTALELEDLRPLEIEQSIRQRIAREQGDLELAELAPPTEQAASPAQPPQQQRTRRTRPNRSPQSTIAQANTSAHDLTHMEEYVRRGDEFLGGVQ